MNSQSVTRQLAEWNRKINYSSENAPTSDQQKSPSKPRVMDKILDKLKYDISDISPLLEKLFKRVVSKVSKNKMKKSSLISANYRK